MEGSRSTDVGEKFYQPKDRDDEFSTGERLSKRSPSQTQTVRNQPPPQAGRSQFNTRNHLGRRMVILGSPRSDAAAKANKRAATQPNAGGPESASWTSAAGFVHSGCGFRREASAIWSASQAPVVR